MPAVEIEVLAAPSVNQAMAHNGLAFLHRLVIQVIGTDDAVPDATVQIHLLDSDGTVVSRPFERDLHTLEPAVPVVLDAPKVALNPQYLAQIDEEIAAEIIVTVSSGAMTLGQSHTPIRILAARQWLLEDRAPVRSLELLASFVQPNHPAVTPIVAETAQLLERRTRSGSLAVQHAEPSRIDAVVEAAFDTIRDRNIFYANPPASWGIGQKIRTPEDVFDDRLGTCLDLTIAMASVLEQIGIAPVLWVARGHAFLGYWRHPNHGLPDAASQQISSAANAVDLKLMGVLEATFLARDKTTAMDIFRRASQAPLDSYFLGGSAELVGVVDVGMARMLNVFPVPARRLRTDGVVEIIEYRPPVADLPDAGPVAAEPVPSRAANGAPSRPNPPPRVQAWKNSLLDLTLRNRLLNLGHQLTQLGLVLPSEQLGTVANLLQDGKTISVRAVDDLTGAVIGEEARDAYALPGDIMRSMLLQRSTIYSTAPGSRHKDAMQRLRYRARNTLEETGANPLALTLGRLDWKLGDKDLSAPLLVAPIDIRGVVQPFKIAFDHASQVTLNLSLMEKLRIEFDFTVPGLAELPGRADGDGVDVDAVLRMVREAIAAAELPFRVESEARLAILSFTGYLLWRDLDDHWEKFCERPLVKHLVSTPTQRFADGDDHDHEAEVVDLDEVVAVAPIPSDGSQAEAIAAARAGKSFVLEGPPGTGKSQTITNILADQMAHGRTVMFVAEKGAALDVVRARLGQVGLLPYTLDLHDHNARPAEVRTRLKSALSQLPAPDSEGHQVVWSDARSAARSLSGYAARLHEPNSAGLSLYGAHNHRLARGAGEILTIDDRLVTAPAEEIAAIRRAVADAEPMLAELADTDAPAWGFAGRDVGSDGLPALFAAVARADVAAQRAVDGWRLCGTKVAELLRSAGTDDELAATGWLLSAALPDGVGFAELGSRRWRGALAELQQRTGQLLTQAAPTTALFEPTVYAVPLDQVRLSVREAAASFFIGRKGRLLRAAAPVLSHLRPGATLEPKAIPQQVGQIANLAGQSANLLDAWRSLPGCRHLPAELNLASDAERAELEQAVGWCEQAAGLLDAMSPTRRAAIIAARTEEPPVERQVDAALTEALSALAPVFELTGSSPVGQHWFAGDAGLLPRWLEGVPLRQSDHPHGYRLRQWGRTVQALDPLQARLPQARWQLLTGQVGRQQAAAALDRGLAAASVAERFAAGGFGTFDPTTQDRTVARYVDASDQLRESLRTALPAEILSRRQFAPGGFFGKVAALEREANRSRGGLSVRKLMTEFGDVVTAVTPCVLVSPDSLARFIPPGSVQFDLVVFDEASQIRVADSIGALGRAAAVIIAGDSKQMPPQSFGEGYRDDTFTEVSGTTDDDEAAAGEEFWVVPDEESILSECVQSGVTRRWLSWHYRSRDESLIAFSNAQYYENRLSTFPAVPGQVHDTGVSFVRVQGQFIRSERAGTDQGEDDQVDGSDPAEATTAERRRMLRTNPAEAATVVQEVLRRWQNRERSIGVVTFNVQQRSLIEQLLWDSGVEGVAESLVARAGGEGLFVKNLENVQGDERDVILFSTGFSANANGILPLNFGPLNRSGGERRLNVAITRARRRVIVFSSFEPEDLRVEQTSSVGLRHLRAYLEMAKYGVSALEPSRTDVGAALVAPALTSMARSVAVDRHRDEIAAALQARGVAVQTSLGLSEFRVDLALAGAAAPDRPVLAVLLDSPEWAGRRTTGDRDGLPLTVLSQLMGWPRVSRVWLPDWLTDPDRVLDRLGQQLTDALTAPRSVGETQARTHWDVFDPEQLDTVSDLEPDAEPDEEPVDDPERPGADRLDDGPELTFVAFQPHLRASRSVLDKATQTRPARRQVQQLISEIVELEGPVSIERLARLVAACHGISRVVDSRLADIRSVVPETVRRDPEEGFCWPDTRDPLRWHGYRRTPAGGLKERPLDDVALREIANAAAYIVRNAMGITTEELTKELVRVFGGSRVTATLKTRIATAVELGVRLRILRTSGELVVPGDGRTQLQ